MHHYKKCKKHCKKTIETKKKSTETNTHNFTKYHSNTHSHSHSHSHSKCNCEQIYYDPLPNLPSKPHTQTVTPIEWFSPGSVQVCCSICSSVKPIYSTPCNGYCCGQYK